MPESSRRRRDKRSRHAPHRDRGRDWGDPGVEPPSRRWRPRIRPRTWGKIRRWSFVTGAAVVAALVIGSFAIQAIPRGGGATGSGAEVGQRVALLPRTHIPVEDTFNGYNSVPPTSGPHWESNWASCGIFDDENEVPDERITHNMEHGQVIISYNLQDEQEIDRLKEIARDLPSRRNWMIMRPYSRIPDGEVAVTSWGWIDRFEGVDESGIRDFYDAHLNNGPESISCLTGG